MTCYQDQHVPSLAQQLRQDAKLKTLFQCQDTELQPPYPYEDQELRILEAPLQSEEDEQETPNRYHDEEEEKLHHYLDEEEEKKVHHYLDEEQEKKVHHYLDEEQEKKLHHYLDLDEEQEKKPFQDQDGERKTPKQYLLDEDQKTLQQCQDEEEKVPNQYEDEENTPGQYQDEEQKTAKQCKEEEVEKTSEKYQDEEHKSLKAQHQCQDTEQKAPGQCKTAKKLITPPCADDMPRFSLQDLIQEKQLLLGEAKATSKLGNGEKAIADHKLPAPPAAGGAMLAMVIKRPDGGKKSMGVIRRCVKALNQMVKAKHGSKKNKPF
ncbi:hypothetical protein E2562_037337 [Oryza meyeriana var. granulata]|uniref:Uncharacterized protein n=1 Tax=Oryza meyeriana var. granulata TaxID=110450 RepID=A0A6G1CBR0_9ORYZ|nr:hypothetical protein E2562_037337 [Oryza meyeriana var. granulata]